MRRILKGLKRTSGVGGAILVAAALAGPAQAATTTYPAGASGFDGGTADGWTASGETCSLLSGALLCNTDAAHTPTGGNPGGALATNVSVTLNLLGLFQGSAVWTSPTFTVPASAKPSAASFTLDHGFSSGGLLDLTPSSTVTATLVDLAGPTTPLVSGTLDSAATGFATRSAGVSAGAIVPGHSYQLRIASTTTSTIASIGLLGTASTLVDNVGLTVVEPDDSGPTPPPATPDPNPNPNPNPTPDPPAVTPGVRIVRSSLSNTEISSLMRQLNIDAEVGNGPGGSLVPLAQCTILGTAGADRIVGTNGNDVICGLGGNDVIDGVGGRDVVDGGDGADRLAGDLAGDLLLGLRGDDRLRGGSGDDGLGAGAGNDSLVGGAGRDRLSGRSGRDRLDGGTGSDRLAGASGNDVLFGRTGNDRLAGAAGSDRLNGGKGTDRLLAGGGRDRLAARDGFADVVDGGPGFDAATIDRPRRGGRGGTRGLRLFDRALKVERVR